MAQLLRKIVDDNRALCESLREPSYPQSESTSTMAYLLNVSKDSGAGKLTDVDQFGTNRLKNRALLERVASLER